MRKGEEREVNREYKKEKWKRKGWERKWWERNLNKRKECDER